MKYYLIKRNGDILEEFTSKSSLLNYASDCGFESFADIVKHDNYINYYL